MAAQIDSRDKNGHYCGQRDETGEFVDLGPEKVGYCGPHCSHCVSGPLYTLEDGIWVCVVDSSYMDLED